MNPDGTGLGQKIGFFGAGKMATALARGILNAGLCLPGQALASDVEEKQRENFERETGIKAVPTNEEVASFCDLAVLAVKPTHVREVLSSIRAPFGEKLLVSIAAGISISTLEKGLVEGARVIRVMPNTPALVRTGASAFSLGRLVTQKDAEMAGKLLGAVGIVFQLPENLLDAVTGLSGSGPAYVFLMIEALMEGGIKMGLAREVATKLSVQTVLGAAKLMIETGREAKELREMVTSPGGTTMEGLRVLNAQGVPEAFIEAVRAATEKSRLLGKAC